MSEIDFDFELKKENEVEYRAEGLQRVAVAIFAQAARDVHHSDLILRENARHWFRFYGVDFAMNFRVGIPIRVLNEWIENGFVLIKERKTWRGYRR